MAPSYSSYQGIKPFYITLFERLWTHYISTLPVLPTDIQSQENTKAAVFNLWVNFYDIQGYLIIKTDKSFSHTFEDHLAKRLNMHVPQSLSTIVSAYRSKHHHAFLYCYFLSYQVLKELAIFSTQHEELEPAMLKKYNYYYIGDADFEPENELYFILKLLNYEFLQLHLTHQKYEELHRFAYQEIQPYLTPSI